MYIFLDPTVCPSHCATLSKLSLGAWEMDTFFFSLILFSVFYLCESRL